MPKHKINWKHPIWEEIYNECMGKCMVTGSYIPYHLVTNWNFHHIISKNKGRQYWYNKDNIVFCTQEMHTHMETMTKEKYYKLVKEYPKLELYFDVNKLK